MRLTLPSLLLLLTGCAYLRPTTLETQTLVTSRACAQGPLRIETRTLGARWGEWYALEVVSPRALKGHLRWKIADESRLHEPWVTSQLVQNGRDQVSTVDTVFDSKRCLERPPVVVEQPQPQQQPAWQPPAQPQQPAWQPPPQPQQPAWQPPPQTTWAPPPSGGPPPLPVTAPTGFGVEVTIGAPTPQPTAPQPQPPATPEFEPLAFPVSPELGPVQLVAGGEASRQHTTMLLQFERRNEDARAPAPVAAGQPVVIEVWSETPNDYAGAAFIFSRGPMEPNVTEAEWLAELDKREAARRADAERDAARDAEAAKRRAEEHAQRVAIENERRRAEALELERRRAANIAARDAKLAQPKVETAWDRERRALYANGLAAPSKADEAYVEERRREFERRQAEAAAEAEARRLWRLEQERRWAEYEARRPKPRPPPPGPPPEPPPQTIPLKPAPYVLWIDGYFEWTGVAWVWLDGWWKVNDVERARYEAAARLPAPAPRVEARPPCPVPDGQWQAGTWVWNLEAWVWLPGVWLSVQRPVHQAVPVAPPPKN